MPNMDRTELENAIGIAAASANKYDEQHLLRLIEGRDTASSIVRNNVQQWLMKQGLPSKNVANALPASLATAYVNPNYLRGWRRKVNPSWDLLGNADADTSAQTFVIDEPKTTATGEAVLDAKAKDELLTQASNNAKILIEDALAKTTLKLDESAKEAIRTLASTSAMAAARATVAELMPPRTIEVRQAATGTTVNIGLQHKCFPKLLRAVQARDHRGFGLNIWLTGPTGSGKTSAGEAVAKALGMDFGSDGSLDADYKVLGFRDANGNVISTEFIRIYTNGGVYIADEIDNWMPSALLSLNAALANGWMTTPAGMVKRHANAVIIACANTWGLGATSDYVGRTRLDAASLDRFQPKLDWPYDEALEMAIADGMDPTLGRKWCRTVQSARAAAQRQGLKIIVSPRATFSGISLLQQDFTQDEVIDMTFAAGLSQEQRKSIGFITYALGEAA